MAWLPRALLRHAVPPWGGPVEGGGLSAVRARLEGLVPPHREPVGMGPASDNSIRSRRADAVFIPSFNYLPTLLLDSTADD